MNKIIRLTEAQKSQIRKRYNGTWQSLLQLSYDFRVSPNMISYLVNHKGHKEKALALGKRWRTNHPGSFKTYYKKHRKRLLKEARERYQELMPKMKKMWAEKARQRYWDKKS